jgi:hypothetical protein
MLKVKAGIANGFFEDGERMERLDVIFANRYLEAFEQYHDNKVPTRSWRLTLETSNLRWPIVLQHLLLGMNAHINLDLGVAAARTSLGEAVHDLKRDFNRINAIFASLIDEVEQELARIWPLLKLLDRIGGRTDEAMINFSIEKARDHAWKVAQDLAPLEKTYQTSRIDKLDNEVAILGKELAEILKIRKDKIALRRGRQYLRPISGDGANFGLPRKIGNELRSIVPWSRIFNTKEILLAINTDYFQPKTAWVTIDNGLHEAGDRLTCIYSTDRRQLNSEVVVETRNGKSVLLTIPAAGFLIYE